MRKNLLYMCVLLITGANYATAAAQKTVCTMTINSTDEREIFQKHLIKQGFKFVELTKFGNASNWFQNACAAKVQCDMLVVSGHFGGTFFGDNTDLKLSTEELEAASCNSKCDGILKAPTEVFLFGCNTLASKKKDHRTIQEYIDVLVADNYTPRDAQRVAEARYGPWDVSFKKQMQGFFAAPRIYGFKSVSPLGAGMRDYLDKYLYSVPDYNKHLNNYQMADLVSGLDSLDAAFLQIGQMQSTCTDVSLEKNRVIHYLTNRYKLNNQALLNALRETHLKQVSGLKSQPFKAEKCSIIGNSPREQKLLGIEKILRDEENRLNMVPTITRFFNINNDFKNWPASEKAIVERIKAIPGLQTEIQRLLAQITTPFTILDFSAFATNLEWITKAEYEEYLLKVLKIFYKKEIVSEENQVIYGLAEAYPDLGKELKLQDINPKNLTTIWGLNSIAWTKPEDPEIAQAIVDSGALNHQKKEVRQYAIMALLGFKNLDEKIHIAVSNLLTDPEKEIRGLAAHYLSQQKTTNGKVQLALIAALNEKEEAVLNTIAFSLTQAEFKDEQVIDGLIAFFQNQNIPEKNRAMAMLVLGSALKSKNNFESTFVNKIESTILTALSDKAGSVRKNAAWIVGVNKIKNEKINLALIKLMIADKDASNYVAEALSIIKPNSKSYQLALAEAFTMSKDKKVREYIGWLMATNPPTEPKALLAIQNAINDAEEIVKSICHLDIYYN